VLVGKRPSAFTFEFAEQIVPRLPEQFESSGQKAFQQQIDSRRRSMEMHHRREEQKNNDVTTPNP